MKIIGIIFAILTLVSSLLALFILPDTVAVHFNQYGEVDRWGSKYEVLILPAILILAYIVFELIIRNYLKKIASSSDEKEAADANSNIRVMNVILPIINGFMMIFNIVFLYSTYKQTLNADIPDIDIMKYVSMLMSLLIIFVGNYMPKTRKNSSVGFRLPWTRYNDVTWSKSNRFAAYVMMIAGGISLIGSIIWGGTTTINIMLISFLTAIVIMTLYAYVIYKKEKDNERSNQE